MTGSCPRYAVTVLGAPRFEASGFNERWVVGQVRAGRNLRAAMFSRADGALIVLEAELQSVATAINTHDVVAGRAGGAPCVWRDRARSGRPGLGGSACGLTAINARGTVVGWSDTPEWVECLRGTADAHRSPLRRAFVHAGAAPLDLGTLGGDDSLAHALNDRGDVVGEADVATDRQAGTSVRHAFLKRNDGPMIDLDAGAARSKALAINEGGAIACDILTHAGVYRACRWQGGTMRDLGTLDGEGGPTFARAINADGDIVGTSSRGAERGIAVLFRDGVVWDLRACIEAADVDSLSHPLAIDDDGVILCAATNAGARRDVLLTPR